MTLLCADNLRADGLFDAAAVERLMREHEAPQAKP